MSCDYDSGYHCQLEISTFTFLFIQLRIEFIFKFWKRCLTINPHSLVLMNLNQVLLSRQCGLSKSFGDYCKSHCPKERQEWGRIKDLYAAVVASDFKMRAFLKSDHNQNAEAGEL